MRSGDSSAMRGAAAAMSSRVAASGSQAVDAAAHDAAQDAQRVVAEGGLVHGSQHAGVHVLASAERIDPLAAAQRPAPSR